MSQFQLSEGFKATQPYNKKSFQQIAIPDSYFVFYILPLAFQKIQRLWFINLE